MMGKKHVTVVTEDGRQHAVNSWVQDCVVDRLRCRVAGYKGHAYYSFIAGESVFMPKRAAVARAQSLMKRNMTKFNFSVNGTPCVVKVTYFKKVRPWAGSPENCQSDLDWYGYTEVEYELYDRQGYRAEWLEDAVDDETNAEIEREAERHVNEL